MLFKVISILGALIALAFFLMRSFGGKRGREGPLKGIASRFGGGGARGAPAETAPCPECGVYREVGALCPCQRAPLP